MNGELSFLASRELLPPPRGMTLSLVEDGRVPGAIPFLHDTAVTVHRGSVYVVWYNSTAGEIAGTSLIRGRRSDDGGATWSGPFTVVGRDTPDADGTHFVPPALFSDGGRLYAAVSRMTAHDRVTSVGLYRRAEDGDAWERLADIAPCFIPNGTPVKTAEGRWLIAGRCAAVPGGHPEIPALILSDPSDLTAPWEMKPFYDLHDTARLGVSCPETTVWAEDGGRRLTAFTRCDDGVRPHFLFRSTDGGVHWSEPEPSPLPAAISKQSALVLPDGRRAVAFDLNRAARGFSADRTCLVLNVEGRLYTILNGDSPELGLTGQWSYPCLYAEDGRLYISATNQGPQARSAVLAAVDVAAL